MPREQCKQHVILIKLFTDLIVKAKITNLSLTFHVNYTYIWYASLSNLLRNIFVGC